VAQCIQVVSILLHEAKPVLGLFWLHLNTIGWSGHVTSTICRDNYWLGLMSFWFGFRIRAYGQVLGLVVQCLKLRFSLQFASCKQEAAKCLPALKLLWRKVTIKMNLLQFVKVLCLKSVAISSQAWMLFTTLGTCVNAYKPHPRDRTHCAWWKACDVTFSGKSRSRTQLCRS